MSTKNPEDKLSDKEVEDLFEKQIEKENSKFKNTDQTEKIVTRAIRQSSTKNVAEFAFVKFWTGVLEFAAIFGMFIKQKSVNKDNQTNDDDQTGAK